MSSILVSLGASAWASMAERHSGGVEAAGWEMTVRERERAARAWVSRGSRSGAEDIVLERR